MMLQIKLTGPMHVLSPKDRSAPTEAIIPIEDECVVEERLKQSEARGQGRDAPARAQQTQLRPIDIQEPVRSQGAIGSQTLFETGNRPPFGSQTRFGAVSDDPLAAKRVSVQ